MLWEKLFLFHSFYRKYFENAGKEAELKNIFAFLFACYYASFIGYYVVTDKKAEFVFESLKAFIKRLQHQT